MSDWDLSTPDKFIKYMAQLIYDDYRISKKEASDIMKPLKPAVEKYMKETKEPYNEGFVQCKHEGKLIKDIIRSKLKPIIKKHLASAKTPTMVAEYTLWDFGLEHGYDRDYMNDIDFYHCKPSIYQIAIREGKKDKKLNHDKLMKAKYDDKHTVGEWLTKICEKKFKKHGKYYKFI